MARKAQGSLEYILLLGAVLFLIVIGIIIVRTNILFGGAETTQTGMQQWNTTISAMCDVGIPCPSGYACYETNGSCLPNLLVNNPSFESDLAIGWNVSDAAAINRTNTTRADGTWSATFNASAHINYSTAFENVSGAYVAGMKAKTNGSCGIAVGFWNTSFVGGVCQAYAIDPGYSSTSSTSWTTVATPITLSTPSCIILIIGEPAGGCDAYADAAYLIKVS
ncbi:MAG: hypothetical protein AB1626_04365 [Candidatus Micrarchaeota archaeon]